MNKSILISLLIIMSLGQTSCKKKDIDDKGTLREYADKIDRNIGVAVYNRFFMDSTNVQYTKILKDEFNTVVAENAMKPYMMEPKRGTFVFSRADKLAKFAGENGMKMRGHCLVWHNQIPDWMNNDQLSKEELLSIMKKYITTVVGHLKGKVYAWDVVNEAINVNEPDHYRKSVWMKVIGPEYIDSAFVWAHQADPNALLFYNDYDAENMNAKSDAVYKLVKNLKNRGVPINGVGLQCHFQLGKIDFDGIKKNMQRLKDLDLQTQITELDISIDAGKENAQTLQQQAAAYGKLAKLWLEDTNCTAFMIWGVSDQYSWIPGFSKNKRGVPLLWDKDFNKKPAWYQVLNQLKESSVN